ncbi:hypothetical protein BDY24DRAFT_382553 [Mrakia frigida]|uniref:uncharacterized protein n=1 Tax=Mrakia frigida TaxID=29902 RepID=UPI003FCC181A
MAHQQPRQLSNQELLEVASNLLGIGLGRPSAFARSQFSGSGVSTPSSLGPDLERQASHLERLLLLSVYANSLRSASDSVLSTLPTRDAPTPRSISSPVPGSSRLEVPAMAPPPVVQESTKETSVLLDVVVPRVATPHPPGVVTIPLPPIGGDVAIARVGQQQPQPTVVEETRPRTETYQVRRDDSAARSRASTLDSRSPIGSAIHNHSQHDENFIFLRAGKPPGFAAGGARRPGPRAGLPPRTMAMRAIDAMTKATLREGKGGGALVASERKEVLERGEKVLLDAEEEIVVAPVQVGALWKVRAPVEQEVKVAGAEKRGRKEVKESSRTADGFLTVGSLSAMFGESSKSNVPSSLPTRPKQDKPKSFVAALSVGLPKKPDFPSTSPLPSPTLTTRGSRSPSAVEAVVATTPVAPRASIAAPSKTKDAKSRSRKQPSIGSKASASALRTDGGAR